MRFVLGVSCPAWSWSVLRRCLPVNRSQWPEHLRSQREQYARFVQDLIFRPAENVTHSGGATFRVEAPTLGGLTRLANTARATSTVGGGSDDSGRNAEVLSRPGVSDLQGNLGEMETAKGIAGAEALGPVGNGTTGPVRTPQGSPERDNGEKHVNRTIAQDPGHPATKAPVVLPSSLWSCPSEHSPGGSRATRGLKPTDDDPLSNKETSEWAALWSDKELMQAIDQDVVRTMPDLAFYACRGMEDDDEDGVNGSGDCDVGRNARGEQKRRGRERRLAIARILFVHAKLNPAESYTQGMNEIVATLFFVLATDGREEWSRHCEADTFFCFTNLMAEIRDVFIQSLDESESGLHGKMEAFSRTLRQHDPELADHMVRGRVEASLFVQNIRFLSDLIDFTLKAHSDPARCHTAT